MWVVEAQMYAVEMDVVADNSATFWLERVVNHLTHPPIIVCEKQHDDTRLLALLEAGYAVKKESNERLIVTRTTTTGAPSSILTTTTSHHVEMSWGKASSRAADWNFFFLLTGDKGQTHYQEFKFQKGAAGEEEDYSSVLSVLPPMQHTRSFASCVWVNRRLYVCGGVNTLCSRGWTVCASVEMWDESTLRWHALASMTRARCGASAFVHLGRYIYVYDWQGTEMYDTLTDAWTVVPMFSPKTYAVDMKAYLIPSDDGGHTTEDANRLAFLELEEGNMAVRTYWPYERRWERTTTSTCNWHPLVSYVLQ